MLGWFCLETRHFVLYHTSAISESGRPIEGQPPPGRRKHCHVYVDLAEGGVARDEDCDGELVEVPEPC